MRFTFEDTFFPFKISKRNFIVQLAFILSIPRHTFAKDQSKYSAMWVWKDRVLSTEQVGAFAEKHGIDTLFVYVSPEAGRALFKGDNSALANLKEMRGNGRKLYALVGEPEWAWGTTRIPEHAQMALELAANQRIFDGIHFDIEPHSLEEWQISNERIKLMRGLIEFYQLIRNYSQTTVIEAAVNPIYAELSISSGNFLEQIMKNVDAISIMAYRKDVRRALDWANPSIQIAEKIDKGWRMALAVDDSGILTSWNNLSSLQLNELVANIQRQIIMNKSYKNYLGLSYQDYDGLKEVFERH
jgi:hypothetical protein